MEKMFCPLLNNECKFDECMMFVISNGVKLGCAFNVTAKQLDKMAYVMRKSSPQNQQRETEELH